MNKLNVLTINKENKPKNQNRHAHHPNLFSKRLMLKQLSEKDAQYCFDSLSNPSVFKFIPQDPPTSIEKVLKAIKNDIAGAKKEKHEQKLSWVVWTLDEKKCFGLFDATLFDHSEVEIGIIIFPKYWKQGIGSEACSHIVNYLFKEIGSSRVFANVNAYNEASIRLFESLGFEFVGSYFEEYVANEMSQRGYQYELTRESYIEAQKSEDNQEPAYP